MTPGNTSLSSHRLAAKVYTEKLDLTTEQRDQIQWVYSQNIVKDLTYQPNNETEQISATALLATHNLDFDARESLASRWSIKWGVNSSTGEARNRRVLYQWLANFRNEDLFI